MIAQWTPGLQESKPAAAPPLKPHNTKAGQQRQRLVGRAAGGNLGLLRIDSDIIVPACWFELGLELVGWRAARMQEIHRK